jgi:hypothetical protein
MANATMTKYFLSHLLLLLATFTGTAQQHKVEYGFRGGINLNTAYGSGISKQYSGYTTGLSIGGHLKVNTSAHFGVKISPLYDVYGWAYRDLYLEDSVNGLAKADVIFKPTYLNVPVLAEYTWGRKVKVSVGAGGFFGLLLSSRYVTKLKTPISGRPAVTKTNSESFKRFNAGLTGSVGVQVPLTSRMALSVHVQNATGLTNINKAPAGAPNMSDIKTLTFSALAGLRFHL